MVNDGSQTFYPRTGAMPERLPVDSEAISSEFVTLDKWYVPFDQPVELWIEEAAPEHYPDRFYQLYEPVPAPSPYDVLIDLGADGVFDLLQEVETTAVLANPGISWSRGLGSGAVGSLPAAGSASLTLRNDDGYYSPSASNHVNPGDGLRLTSFSSGERVDLWTGNIYDHREGIRRGDRKVEVVAVGRWAKLVGHKVSTSLYEGISTGIAIGHVLDAAGWPAADRDIDAGVSSLTWWWADNEDAAGALRKLLETEGPGALLYEDGSGKIIFRGRNALVGLPRSVTVQATYGDTKGTIDLALDHALALIINDVEFETRTRTAAALATVWTLGSTVVLAANEVRVYTAKPSDPFKAAVCTAGTDYTVSAGSVTLTLNRTSGGSVTLTLTAGGSGATVTGLQLRAQLCTVQSTTLIRSILDVSSSVTEHGRRKFSGTIHPEIDVDDAQAIADAILLWWSNGRTRFPVTIATEAGSLLDSDLVRMEIGDRVALEESWMPVSEEAWILDMRHTVSRRLFHTAQFELEIASEGTGFGPYTLDCASLTNDATVGTVDWTNPANACAEDGVYASATVGTTKYLKGLLPAAARVPTTATVIGVRARVKRRGTAPSTFNYTGAEQTYVVPAGVTTMRVEAWGASGAGSGGKGGYVAGTLTVTPGETLRIYVGQDSGGGAGGYNGGGASGGAGAGGGGGASDVRQGGAALANRVLIGAGGGGVGTTTVGGDGGADIGENGDTGSGGGGTGGGGGTQSAGGVGGGTGSAGSLGLGGAGGSGTYAGGGGGAGYYGGGGGSGFGSNNTGAGGGGSNLVTGANTVSTRGVWLGNGKVTLTPLTYDNSVRLVVGGVIVGDNKASADAWPSTAAFATYGSGADLWGTAITPAQANAADFGLVVSAVNNGTAEIDYAEISLYYI